MIIGRGKRAIEEHFSRNFELEAQLKEKGKEIELALINSIPGDVNIHFVWQHTQNGLGDAIRYAKDHVGNEPFAVLLGDTVLESAEERPVTRQLMDVYDRYEELVVALEEVSMDRVHKYGVVDGHEIEESVLLVKDMVEKPKADEAPSNLVIASRYILPPEIFRALDQTPPGKGGEIQLTDAMKLLHKDRAMYGRRINGTRHDLGDKLEFLKTSILYALKRDDMKAELMEWMKEIVK